MRQLAGGQLKVTVRADVNRDALLVKFGAWTFAFTRKEALNLTQQIVAAFDDLMSRKYGVDRSNWATADGS